DDAHDLEALVARRVEGEPLEHVLGYVDFHGLRIGVDPGVFVPRQRTVLLVDEAVALARRRAVRTRPPETVPGQAGDPVVVVDVCCGAGALGLAVATDLGFGADAGRRPVDLHVTDLDPAAVACAARNVAAVGGVAYRGDLFDPLPTRLRGRVDVLLANVPYVPTGEIPLLPPEARDHQARAAVDGRRRGAGGGRAAPPAAPDSPFSAAWRPVRRPASRRAATCSPSRGSGRRPAPSPCWSAPGSRRAWSGTRRSARRPSSARGATRGPTD